ncbi:hypothetical protein [Burkholderia sp. Bp8990]|uniref:hypothetical protein n=1 Tax=Burkholderia sp. Bp8990 TaxID=2184552 RepID=UPI0021AB5964|nr:hypothetical protein [Burkholderia sp. Bp8990]
MPLSAPSRTLEMMLAAFDYAAVDEEFNRALSNLESEPREAVSAASNTLHDVVYASERLPEALSAVDAANEFCGYMLENLREAGAKVLSWFARC